MEELELHLDQILDLLSSAGYVDATKPDMSPADKIAGGLSWCIAAINASEPTTVRASVMQVSLSAFPSSQTERLNQTRDDDNTQCIEEALRLVGCPHPLQPSHIRNLDTKVIFPVIQWLTIRVRSRREDGGYEVCHSEHTVEEDEHTLQQLRELEETEISIKTLSGNLDELNHQKINVVKQLDHLRQRINKEGDDSVVQKLVSLMASMKDLERQENHFKSIRDSRHYELQAEISELERKIANGCDSKSLSDGPHDSFSELLEKLNLIKKQLAARLRDIVAVRRQIDDLPCQSELIQYERRLSELNAQIQGKHRQTRKYYTTYNALLEIKELMLKETSLLNSIISQFQEAFSSADGRVKLVHSMEGIVKGSEQKLGKVQLGLQQEGRIRDDLKERYAATVGEQKRCYSLSKAFQVECAKNERLGVKVASENC